MSAVMDSTPVALVLAVIATLIGVAIILARSARTPGTAERSPVEEALADAVEPSTLSALLANGGEKLGLAGTKKSLSILVAEMKGYGQLAGPEALAAARDFLGAMGADVKKRHGRIDRLGGDTFVAVFGDLDVGGKGHAAAAVETALAMQSDAARLQRKWSFEGKPGLIIRLGVATGTAFVGDLSTDARVRYVTFGDAPTLAGRLAAKAPPSGVLVADETRLVCEDRFEFQAVPGLVLKGLPEGYKAFLAVGPKLDMDPERVAVRLPTRAEVGVRTATAKGTGRVDNVSAGGMYVASALVPGIGEFVEVEFPPHPDIVDSAAVVVRGEVRHTRPESDGSKGFGMSIERADSAKAEAIRHFIALYFGPRTGPTPTRIQAPTGEALRVELGGNPASLVREK
jgi:class 3 adenylate cyclase